VGVIRGGCSTKALTILSTANEISASWGIQVTPTGKIAVADQENPTIYTYDPPVKDALGTPIATTPLTGVEDPAQFAFMKSGAYLFVAAEASNKALKFAYPAGGNALKSIGGRHMDGPVGVVVTPGAQQ
jgi:DNA-binding beta-propeller fold protein YncE